MTSYARSVSQHTKGECRNIPRGAVSYIIGPPLILNQKIKFFSPETLKI